MSKEAITDIVILIYESTKVTTAGGGIVKIIDQKLHLNLSIILKVLMRLLYIYIYIYLYIRLGNVELKQN